MPDKIAILVVTGDEQRLWAALTYAASSAALGKTVSVFLSGHAAVCGHREFLAALDASHRTIGVATCAELFASCGELGVGFFVCQTGMQVCSMAAEDLARGCVPTGTMAWLVSQKDAATLVF
jgi:predicted peroxiredoxin